MSEVAVCVDCAGAQMVGVLHRPDKPGRRGVLFVVAGGPQYRIGGHRQMLLWSRQLASQGYAAFRFDYRGVGDSYGDFRGFQHIDDDLRCALDRFSAEVPEVDEFVLWGECNAVSAMLFYAYRDTRIKGLVMLNPWVRTEAGQARAVLRHYYLDRLMQKSFWGKILKLQYNPWTSLCSALNLARRTRAAKSAVELPVAEQLYAALPRDMSLPDRMLAGFQRFKGQAIIVMSGRDLIAREFDDLLGDSPAWREKVESSLVTRHDIMEADHTFSSHAQREQVVKHALAWLRIW